MERCRRSEIHQPAPEDPPKGALTTPTVADNYLILLIFFRLEKNFEGSCEIG
jgi:hypothetical protein